MMNNRVGFRLLILAAAAFLTIAAAKTDKSGSDAVVAVVGGEKITDGYLQEILDGMSPQDRRSFEGPEGRKMLLDNIIKNRLLEMEAERLKLDKDADVARQLEQARTRILATAYFSKYIASTLGIPDAEVAKYYEEHKEEFLVPAKVTLRHILVATPEEAEAVLTRLKAREDFAAVAAEVSQDEYTGYQGGLIGEVTEEYVPFQVGNCEKYKETVFNLAVKTPSAPCRSDRGYHIFYIDEKKDATYAPLEQVSSRIREDILVPLEDVKAYYEDHRDEYVVEAGVLVRQFVVATDAQARALAGRARGGEDFESLVKLYSTDATTKSNGGLLGWQRPGGYIQGIGQNAEVEAALFGAKEGDIVGPIKLDDGFHVFKVERVREHRQMDFDEVRARIYTQLSDERRRAFFEQAFRDLEKQLKVQRFGWARTYEDMAPEELMDAAEKAATPFNAIQAYDKYVDRFADRPDADKALFMSGFLYAEELRDYAVAKDKFRKLLTTYPESDYAASASWMLEHMGEEDAGLPPGMPSGVTPPVEPPMPPNENPGEEGP